MTLRNNTPMIQCVDVALILEKAEAVPLAESKEAQELLMRKIPFAVLSAYQPATDSWQKAANLMSSIRSKNLNAIPLTAHWADKTIQTAAKENAFLVPCLASSQRPMPFVNFKIVVLRLLNDFDQPGFIVFDGERIGIMTKDGRFKSRYSAASSDVGKLISKCWSELRGRRIALVESYRCAGTMTQLLWDYVGLMPLR